MRWVLLISAVVVAIAIALLGRLVLDSVGSVGAERPLAVGLVLIGAAMVSALVIAVATTRRRRRVASEAVAPRPTPAGRRRSPDRGGLRGRLDRIADALGAFDSGGEILVGLISLVVVAIVLAPPST